MRDRPDAAAWADSMDQEVRLGLHGRTETQLLLGRAGRGPRSAPTAGRGSSRRGSAPRATRAATPAGCAPRTWTRRSTGSTGPTAYVAARTATCLVDGEPVVLSFGTVLWLREVDLGVRSRWTCPAGGPARWSRRRSGSSDKGELPSDDPGAGARGGPRVPRRALPVGRHQRVGPGLLRAGAPVLAQPGGAGPPRRPRPGGGPARRAGAAGRRTARRPVLLRPAGRADLPRRVRDPPGRGRRHPLDAARPRGRRADRGRAAGPAPARDARLGRPGALA